MAGGEDDSKCGCCNYLVNNDDDALLCDGMCGKWFHIKCVDMTKKLYSKISELENVVVWYCKPCSSKDDKETSTQDSNEKSQSSISYKDALLSNKDSAAATKANVKDSFTLVSRKGRVSSAKRNEPNKLSSTIVDKSRPRPNVSNRPGSNVSDRPRPIIGKKTDCLIKTVPRKKWLFVSRLSVEVGKEDLSSYMKDIFECEIECEEWKTRYDSYRSFKVCVPENKIDIALEADTWPDGVLVKMFRVPRKPVGDESFLPKTSLEKNPT
ncbi:spermatid nucleus differentiation [Homalodisca vitripennis]|nr:spermatid nucleus differentiation [Homalodisca vitripennis]